MTSRKLSESDKQEILHLYRQPGETTSTLANRYGVSTSTISRILKTSFSEAEYETLIQHKRGHRAAIETDLASEPPFEPPLEPSTEPLNGSLSVEEFFPAPVELEEPVAPPIPAGRRLRKRSSAPLEADPPVDPPLIQPEILERVDLAPTAALVEEAVANADTAKGYSDPETTAVEEIFGEDLLATEAGLAVDDDLEEDDEDDLDDDLDDEDDLDDDLDDLENGALLIGGRIAGKALVQVLPLAEASLPRTCYLVVDRSAELIAKPLKEFGDLGQIPEAEVLEKTLPVFDNHRVAKRYSNPRTQRVIKLPDSQVLQKTSSHLQAKGITRLLIDGRVYAL